MFVSFSKLLATTVYVLINPLLVSYAVCLLFSFSDIGKSDCSVPQYNNLLDAPHDDIGISTQSRSSSRRRRKGPELSSTKRRKLHLNPSDQIIITAGSCSSWHTIKQFIQLFCNVKL